MAAARGRKRTDDTTPNRARDIQRAFRARRAAHLESLEERILELEDENNYFRALLNLPPSNRPALGKGPTGRGLAKSRARSTVGNQGDHLKSVSSSPTPPSSDSPCTPTMECPVPLPAPDAFSLDMPNDQDGDHVPPSFGYPSDEKMDSLGIDQYSYPIQRHNSIAEGVIPLHDYDRVGLNQGIPPMDPGLGQGLINDYVWGGVPHVAVTGDLPTPTTQRAFSFTQQIAPPTIPRQSTPAHLRAPQGHRRSNTEPHSLGSLITAYNPAHHRSSSSDAGGYGSPSPPPLISRGGYAVY